MALPDGRLGLNSETEVVMNPDEIKQWLTAEEMKKLKACKTTNDVLRFCHSIIAATRKRSEQRRALMEKHQWVRRDRITMYCSECEAVYDLLTKRTSWTTLGQPTVEWDGKRHGPGCLWAQAIEKGGK